MHHWGAAWGDRLSWHVFHDFHSSHIVAAASRCRCRWLHAGGRDLQNSSLLLQPNVAHYYVIVEYVYGRPAVTLMWLSGMDPTETAWYWDGKYLWDCATH